MSMENISLPYGLGEFLLISSHGLLQYDSLLLGPPLEGWLQVYVMKNGSCFPEFTHFVAFSNCAPESRVREFTLVSENFKLGTGAIFLD